MDAYRTPLKSVLDDIARDYRHDSPAEILRSEPTIIREAEAALWRERYNAECGEALVGVEHHIVDAFERNDLMLIGRLVADAMSKYVANPLEKAIHDAQDAEDIAQQEERDDARFCGYCEE